VDEDHEAVMPAPDAPEAIRHVQIAFTDGFVGDAAVVRVDGNVALALEAVTTQLLLGMADERTLPVPNGPVTLEVELPERGLVAASTLDPETAAVTVAIEGGDLTIRPHRQALGFA